MDETSALNEILAVLPPSGEMTYQAVYDQLQANGKGDAARHFHVLRREGAFAVRTERTELGLVLQVSRNPA